MPSWLPSVPYPPPDQHGFWEPVTSTLQWCEEDYYLTRYSAEIVNTVTNTVFMYLAWKGVRNCQQNGHATVFKVAYYGYFAVSFGSWMFHATLKYPWQLVDELNMIYTTCLMCWASLSHRTSQLAHWLLGLFFVAFCAGVTAYYHFLQDPVFHQVVYAGLTAFLLIRSMWMMETTLRPSWRKSTEEDRLAKMKKGLLVPTQQQQARENERDLQILKTMWIMIAYGLTIFLSGFGLWGIDNALCSTLRVWRRELGMPWGFLLELHGWWHVFTGIGAYCYIVWGIWLRHVFNNQQDFYHIYWPNFWTLPEVVRVEPVSTKINGKAANGTAKH